MNRREFLKFLGIAAGTLAVGKMAKELPAEEEKGLTVGGWINEEGFAELELEPGKWYSFHYQWDDLYGIRMWLNGEEIIPPANPSLFYNPKNSVGLKAGAGIDPDDPFIWASWQRIPDSFMV